MYEEIPRTLKDKYVWLWWEKYWDAIGCGRSEDAAEAYANKGTAELRARLDASQTIYAEQYFENWTPPAGFVLPDGWRDDSWHNDAMPKFVSPCGFYFLWVDYENPDEREWGRDFKRYLIVKVQEAFNVGVSDEEHVLLTDSLDEVLQFINQI